MAVLELLLCRGVGRAAYGPCSSVFLAAAAACLHSRCGMCGVCAVGQYMLIGGTPSIKTAAMATVLTANGGGELVAQSNISPACD